MVLQDYNPLDKNELLQLWWDSWHSSSDFQHPKPIEEWELRFDLLLEKNCIQVAQENDSLVGFVMYDLAGSELSQLFVAPRAQGRGIGSHLFAVASEAMNGNFSLKVLEAATGPRRFYESKGLQEAGGEINHFNGRNEMIYVTP